MIWYLIDIMSLLKNYESQTENIWLNVMVYKPSAASQMFSI